MQRTSKVRNFLLVLAAIRVVLGLLAIPLAPVLYKEHFVVLVLMRPTKEVLLAAGFLIRMGEVWWVPVVAAAAPLAILGVWQFYYLGRHYAPEIRSSKLPWLAGKILPPDRIKAMQSLLKRKGMKVVVLGRLAAFPSSVVGAAAGSCDIPSRRFLPADLAGGLLSIAEVILAGYALGYAYRNAGPWITAVGAVALIAVGFIVARGLRRETERNKRPKSSASKKGGGAKKKKGGRSRRAARATSRS